MQARQALPLHRRVIRVEGAWNWRGSPSSAQGVAEGPSRHEEGQDPQGLRQPLQCVGFFSPLPVFELVVVESEGIELEPALTQGLGCCSYPRNGPLAQRRI